MTWPTVQAVVDKTREIAAGDPDYVYTRSSAMAGCQYVHKDGNGGKVPGCLFGRALIALGAPLDELEKIDTSGVGGEGNSGIGLVLDAYSGTKDTLDQDAAEAREWCNHVQGSQDTGKSWGDAVRDADAYMTAAINVGSEG